MAENTGQWDEDDVVAMLVELEPSHFEHFIAELWERRGWNTEVTEESGDRGIDVIATQSFPYKKKALIQAKRYNQTNSVSGPEIQKYASLKQRSGVDEVIVVTTSQFTDQAIELHEEFNIKLINGQKLVEIIEATSSEDLVMEYAGVLNECPSCGAGTAEGDNYCTECGEHLESHRVPTIEVSNYDETNLTPPIDSEESTNAVVIKIRGRQLRAKIGDSIGRELRRIMLKEGASRNEARRIHREHIRFIGEDGQVKMEALGENPTLLNGQALNEGEKQAIASGDIIDLSNILHLQIERIE